MEELENKFQSMVEMHKDDQISQLNAKIAEISKKSQILEEQKDLYEKEREPYWLNKMKKWRIHGHNS